MLCHELGGEVSARQLRRGCSGTQWLTHVTYKFHIILPCHLYSSEVLCIMNRMLCFTVGYTRTTAKDAGCQGFG
jgi:hypothetical protein